MKGSSDVNIKKINVEAISLMFLEHVRWSVCVCIANILYWSEVPVQEISVMAGTLPLRLLQRWSIPVPRIQNEPLLYLHMKVFCVFAFECLF